MILLLGSTGYIGGAFARYFNGTGVAFRGISRSTADYTRRDQLINLIRDTKATFLINAAGYTGKPNVDACEVHKAECLSGNAVLPGTIREACEACGLTWGHVSSGCIYNGTRSDGSGFTEQDEPNFCFRTNNCSFYSGCKALGEECLQGAENVYVWRVRIPFNHEASPRNYLTKLQTYRFLLDATNSISHLDEFVRAAWQCWDRGVPTGIYNITNTGATTTREIVSLIRQHLTPNRSYEFFASEEDFMQRAAITPRSNCVLDNSKILRTGIELRTVQEAIVSSLQNWQGLEAPVN
jgi:UDP-glucose 4,6-dehydratase